ncbi:Hypothetical predicted protein [Mytilus galloprovincialis]|uniref:Vitelline envelope sperm lysin receptor C-terminal domain-containing protein n=1 Tax=Mytilus galloprovincialis TaxID=29158 RepID=A0A8B6HQ57_MYTGA|nr:Hypothetical predicted protein [Mytilus galloprovincialis]
MNPYFSVEAKCPESILNPPAVITVTADLPSSKPFAVCANGEFLFTMDNFGSYSLPVVFETNATLTCAFYQKSLAADVYSVSVYIPLSERVITIDIPEKIVTCIYDPIGDKETSVQQLEERCGQGSLFKSDAGFITTGKVALSPVFEMFRTAGGNTMKYDCSFVVCRTPCDGINYRVIQTWPSYKESNRGTSIKREREGTRAK